MSRAWFEQAARLIPPGKLPFLNHGYARSAARGYPADQRELVLEVAGSMPLAGRRLLDVGSGHGGPARILLENLRVASVICLDRLPSHAFEAGSRRSSIFAVVSDGGALPIQHASIDVVFCLEAMHSIESVSGFVAGSARTLKKKGLLVIADGGPKEFFDDLEAFAAACGLTEVRNVDLSSGVWRALVEGNSLRRRQFEVIAGPRSPGCEILNELNDYMTNGLAPLLKNGSHSYRSYVWRKD